VYNLCKNELSRSLASKVAENSVIKESPNTVIPGVKLAISNKLTGTFDWITLSISNNTTGNPRPNAKFKGSLRISFTQRFANVSILIQPPP
jgi:hypothetical protein